ncbi:MAG: hypothetical protein P8P49_01920 [Opitutales bacterium]|nr:hypothetical protein [Opitutales bacterium]MDG1324494.1 hypothetical protein [Opitutales bacterium]
MKNSNTLNQVSYNRSVVGNVNWKQIEKKISKDAHLFTREIVFFANNSEMMNQCLDAFKASNLIFKCFDNFNLALRSGLAVNADVVVLVDSFASASRANFTKLLESKRMNGLEVIISDNSTVEKLIIAIRESLSKLNQIETQRIVVENIIQSRSNSNANGSQEDSAKNKIMNEKDFRELLNRELATTTNFAPETILASAIEVIKRIK